MVGPERWCSTRHPSAKPSSPSGGPIPLPEEVETGKATAHYKSRVLRVELPKSPARRRTVKVRVT